MRHRIFSRSKKSVSRSFFNFVHSFIVIFDVFMCTFLTKHSNSIPVVKMHVRALPTFIRTSNTNAKSQNTIDQQTTVAQSKFVIFGFQSYFYFHRLVLLFLSFSHLFSTLSHAMMSMRFMLSVSVQVSIIRKWFIHSSKWLLNRMNVYSAPHRDSSTE